MILRLVMISCFSDKQRMRVSGGTSPPSPQEASSLHMVNNRLISLAPMVQQQLSPAAEKYPPVHVLHFANLMPYRQFLYPVYVQPMPMPGYSCNASWPHSNGCSCLLMPGCSSHLCRNSFKHGTQQFKTVPVGILTVFGNFTIPMDMLQVLAVH